MRQIAATRRRDRLLQFCRCDLSHQFKLVRNRATYRSDKVSASSLVAPCVRICDKLLQQNLTLSPPRAGFPAQGKSVLNTTRRKSGEKNMADNSASYRGRFRWRGVFLLQLGSQINFPNSQQEKRWRFHWKILSYREFFERYASPFLNVFE